MNTTIKTLLTVFLSITVSLLCCNSSFAQKSENDVKYKTVNLKAKVACNDCKYKIEKALAYEKGVKEVTADVNTKIVKVTYKEDKTNPQKIEKVIDDLGYEASIIKNDCKPTHNCTYKKSSCCKSKK